ncbi:MAG: penicillin-binding protein [Gemmatimonadota bacterium]|nr:penicillin-binding protein [Gemmatimonadota bacterium]
MEPRRLATGRRRQGWLLLILLLFGARLGWSLIDIQILSHDSYLEAAQRQQKKRVVIPPERGLFYDRNGVPLGVNRERYEIYLVPRHIADVDRFVERFLEIVPYEEDELREAIARGGWYVRILRGVSREIVDRLEAARLDGVGIETYRVRHYPYGSLAAELLGRVDIDNNGIAGLELQYEDALGGEPGWAIHQRDALGREYPNFAYPVDPPVDGSDVHLTLDIGLQEIVEGALDEAIEKTRAKAASIVVVDPGNGEILALANRDSGKEGSDRNRAVLDQFEPGSTFKIVTLAGLYEEGLVAPGDSLFCENGRWSNEGRVLRDVHPDGWLTVEEVIEESSNICTAKLANRLGEERMYEYARRFGFGLPTGLDYPGEPRGFLKRPDRWTPLTGASMAMGYEVMVTSIQMAMAYAAVANGGELLRPYLVRKVVDPSGDLVYQGRPQRVRRVIEPETAGLVTRALVRVVEMGTARTAQMDVLPVAGKTGTALKTGPGGYVRGSYTSSFAGFFPAADPRYVVFVRIDEPVGSFFGGAVAAPVFRRAMESSLLTETMPGAPTLVSRLRSPERVVWAVSDTSVALPSWSADSAAPVRVDPPVAREWSPMEGPSRVDEGAGVPYVVEVGREVESPETPFVPKNRVKVPDFTGLALREAIGRASRLGIELDFDGSGRVIEQAPEPGELVARGSVVEIVNP